MEGKSYRAAVVFFLKKMRENVLSIAVCLTFIHEFLMDISLKSITEFRSTDFF